MIHVTLPLLKLADYKPSVHNLSSHEVYNLNTHPFLKELDIDESKEITFLLLVTFL